MSTEAVLLLVLLVTVPACVVAFAAGALWGTYIWKREAERVSERWERSLREQPLPRLRKL